MKPLNKTQFAKGFHRCGSHFAKLLTTGALFLSMNSVSHAQWVQGTPNTNLYFQFATGNVGIGTGATPLSRLHVIGDYRLEGNENIFPVPSSGVSSNLNFWDNTSAFTASLTAGPLASNYTLTLPTAVGGTGQVLHINSVVGTNAKLDWITAGTGNVTGSGIINFLPLWSGSATNLSNSVIQQFGTGPIATRVSVLPPPFPPAAPTDVLEIAGSTRVGSVALGPVLAGSASGAPLSFSGVAGVFGGADGNNTDPLTMYRTNNLFDNTELDMSIGDNPEGVPDAAGFNIVDKYVIGATPTFGVGIAGIFQPLFTFSTAGELAVGYGITNKNSLDVGSKAPPLPGATVIPGGNVAIGTYAGVNAAPPNGLIVSGQTGISTATPGNFLEVSNGVVPAPNNLSGLRLTQFAGMTPIAAAAIQPYYLSINASGDVIAALAPGGGSIGPGTLNYEARWNPSTTTLASGVIYDDNSGNIGIGTSFSGSAIAHNNLSFSAGTIVSPPALTIGVEQTTVTAGNGTPLSIIAGQSVTTSNPLNGGDLVLSSGKGVGAGSSNLSLQIGLKGAAGSTPNTLQTELYIQGSTGNIGLRGETSPTTDIMFEGGSPRTIQVDNNPGSNAGKSLTIQAGGATTGTSAKNGGDLILSAGSSQGTKWSDIQMQVAPPSTGTTTNSPQTALYIDGSSGVSGGPYGFVGIGTTTPGYLLDVEGGDAYCNKDMHAVHFVVISDERLKTNIETVPNSLDKVMKLRGVGFDFRSSEFPALQLPTNHQIGFIAQELQKVIPEAVQQRANGFLEINPMMVTPLLVEALKEEKAQLDAKETEIVAANTTISDLNTRVTKLESEIGQLLAKAAGNSTENTSAQGVTFFQNDPNPFSGQTTIYYYVPETVKLAELVVLESTTGATALRIPLSKGSNQVQVSASTLLSSQYIYTIIADGAQLPSKKMTVLH